MTGLFITGADTDAGKTIITAGLLRALRRTGLPAQAVKPVQTGLVDGYAPDADVYRTALRGLPEQADTLAPRTLLSFGLGASPHLAARLEGQRVELEPLREAVLALPGRPLLVEGAGGVLVPLNDTEDTLDLMARLDMPVVVAAQNRLGALNHVLLTVRAVLDRGLALAGVVMTRAEALPEKSGELTILDDNVAFLRSRHEIPHVWEVPYEADLFQEDSGLCTAAWDRVAEALHPLAALCTPAESVNPEGHDLLERDRQVLWHPYTSATAPLPVYEAVKASGTRITLRDGRDVVDGMASWWCAVHGYSHPRLVSAARAQAGRMSHVMFGGITHAPAVRLAERLLAHMPSGLARMFWSDSGSVSVEVALKMALQFWRSQGEPRRRRILAPRGGYHGDTLGAMAVCDPENGMHTLFQGLLTEHLFVPRPDCPFHQPFNPACLAPLEAAFAAHGPELAAMILEPIVQGAGGMWFYHPRYLQRAEELCREHGVLLILDEIATGFGRTGKFFAAEWACVQPDILCCGKALTGGFMSLAGTACTARVAEGISSHGHVFMHGPTFMGNALACRVAEASLDVLETSDWEARVAELSHRLAEGLAPCRELPSVADVRVLGAIGVVECREAVNVARLQRFFVERGVWLRPFNRLIYLMPPYVASADDIRRLTAAVHEALIRGEQLA